MLSRLAESLYWIGRYVERAEDTSRILDVHLSVLIDDPWTSEEAVCASLLSAMGAEAPEPVRTGDVLSILAWETASSASVVGAIGMARENARRCREVISTDLWESINVTWHEAAKVARRTRQNVFFSWVRERASAFNGTADATLTRDDAYHFLTLGRSIERADMTASLVAARALAGKAAPSWVTLLQSCGAYQAFLRRARGDISDRRAVEFLLLDPTFPRSVMSALVAAEKCLDDLAVPTDRMVRGSEAHRVLGMIRSELEFAPTSVLLGDVYPVMERVQSACSDASDAVTDRFFPANVITGWNAS